MTSFLRVGLAVAMWMTAQSAFGQSASPLDSVPRLKHSVVVNGDTVRIGDLVENAGAAAKIAIFRSPDLGNTGNVPAARVLDILRAHDIVLVDTDGVREIEVTRATRTVSAKDLEARIVGIFAGQYGLGASDRLSVRFEREPRMLQLDANADLQVARAAYDPRTTRFDVTLDQVNGATRGGVLRYTGTLVETVETAVLLRPVGRGEVIEAADVVVERRPKAEVTSETLTALSGVTGLAARQPLRAGQPLRRSDLMKPEMVKRDESVTLVYEVPGVLLTMRGKALESGAEGDVINVLNIQSKRTVQGTVTGPGRITIAATLPAVPMNTAAANSFDARFRAQ